MDKTQKWIKWIKLNKERNNKWKKRGKVNAQSVLKQIFRILSESFFK